MTLLKPTYRVLCFIFTYRCVCCSDRKRSNL